MAFVVDASMALAWYFPDEQSPHSDAILRRTLFEEIVVPRHWWLEVANGILMGERRKRSVPAQAARFRERLDLMTIDVDEEGGADPISRIVPLARAHGLTAYDAVYLELAERRGLPLATFDGPLVRAAHAVNVEVLELSE